MEEPQDYEDDGFITQDDAVLEADSDEYETAIQDELAKFHAQRADRYAHLQASSHWVALPLPSPSPVKQQVRVEERQQLTELQDEAALQHKRTEYIPPPRSLALQQHLDGPFPAADWCAAVLQRPVTAQPGSTCHADSNQDHEQQQASASGVANDSDSDTQLNSGPATGQSYDPGFQADELAACASAEAEEELECQSSSICADNAAADGLETNPSTAEVHSPAASDSAGRYQEETAAANLNLSPCETVDSTAGQGRTTDCTAPHQQREGVLFSAGKHNNSTQVTTAHSWEPSAVMQAENSDAEPSETQTAADCRLAIATAASTAPVPEMVVQAQGWPASPCAEPAQGIICDHPGADRVSQCLVIVHAAAAAITATLADAAAEDKAVAGEVRQSASAMGASAENRTGEGAAAVAYEVPAEHEVGNRTVAEGITTEQQEEDTAVADAAVSVDAVMEAALVEGDLHKTLPVASQTGSGATAAGTDPGSTWKADQLDKTSTTSELAVAQAADVASHSVHAQTASDDVASITQQQQQQQDAQHTSDKQQVHLPPDKQQLAEQSNHVIGVTENQGIWQQQQQQQQQHEHEQVLAAVSGQQLQPEELQSQQQSAWGSCSGAALEPQGLAGHLPAVHHTHSQTQLPEQKILQAECWAAADLQQPGELRQGPVEATGLTNDVSAQVSKEQQEAAWRHGGTTLEDQGQRYVAEGPSACCIHHGAAAPAAAEEEEEEEGSLCAHSGKPSEQPELLEQQWMSGVAAHTAVEPAHEAGSSEHLQDTISRSFMDAGANNDLAQPEQQPLTSTEAADTDDGFIYQDEDAGSSGCSSPITPTAETAAAAEEAGLGIMGLTGTATQPGLLQCEGSPQVAATGWCPGEGHVEGGCDTQHTIGWPDSSYEYVAASNPPSATATTAQVAPAQSPTYKVHHSNRPMHSKTRPAASPSPIFMARLSGSSVFVEQSASARYMAGPRLRPESAPARRALSPTSRHGYVSQGLDKGFDRPDSVSGGAGATVQQLGDVYAQQTAAWGCCSTTSCLQLPTRPHTSHDLSTICSGSRESTASPTRRPAWVQPNGVALKPGDAACSGSDGDSSSCSKAVWRSASAERDTRGAAGAHAELRQQQQLPGQSAGRIRPGSAELYGRKLALQDGTAKRASSSKPYGSWQQQRELYGSSMSHVHGYHEIASLQEAYAYEPRSPAAAGNGCCSSWQQQQRCVRAQPGDIPWDDSPIPLNTPNSVPIAAATQSYQVLQAARANPQAAGPFAPCPAATAHSATPTRPRTAGSAGTEAMRTERPSFTPRMLQPRAAVAHIGVHNSATAGSTAGSSVYLVDILQRIRQANDICRRLGLEKQYRLGKGSPVTWQQQQILVELWVMCRDHHVNYDLEQVECAQCEQLEQVQQHKWQLKCCITLEQFNKQYDRLAGEIATACAAQFVGGRGSSRPCSSDRTRYGSQAAAAAGCSPVSRQAWVAAANAGIGGLSLDSGQKRLIRLQSAHSAGDARAANGGLTSSSHPARGHTVGVVSGPAAAFSAA